jgi:hypothetical protein
MKLITTLLSLLLLTGSSKAAEDVFIGSYRVPVEDVLLEDFSSNELTDIKFSVDRLSFKLPAEIASLNAREVEFERIEGTNSFVSAFGMAHCLQKTFTSVDCDVRYNEFYRSFLESNLADTEQFLIDSGIEGDILQKMIDVAKHFSGDPIGVLTIEIPYSEARSISLLTRRY